MYIILHFLCNLPYSCCRDENFQGQVTEFIAKKADLVFEQQAAPTPFREPSTGDAGEKDVIMLINLMLH